MLTVTKPIYAGSTVYFTASPQSTTGAPATAQSAYVKVICVTTNTVIREESPVSVSGATFPFSVTDDENQMQDLSNKTEKRRALLRVVFGIGDEFTDYVEFVITRADLDPNADVS